MLFAGLLVASGCSTSIREPTSTSSTGEPVGKKAVPLEAYGWALAACAWETTGDEAHCVPIHKLLALFPYRAQAISDEVRAATRRHEATFDDRPNVREALGVDGIGLCDPNGEYMLTLGTLSRPDPDRFRELCTPGEKAAPVLGETMADFGRLRPALDVATEGYEAYLEECEEDEAGNTGQPTPSDAEGSSDSSTPAGDEPPDPKTEDAEACDDACQEKKREEELAKLKELKKQAEKKRDEAEKKAKETAAAVAELDPFDTSEEAQALRQAAKDAAARLRFLDQLVSALDTRMNDIVDAQIDAVLQYHKMLSIVVWTNVFYRDNKKWLQAVEETYQGFLGQMPESEFEKMADRMIKAAEKHNRTPRECLVDDCQDLSCEQQARIKAARDFFNQFAHDECNDDATPTPDGGDECHGTGTPLRGEPVSAATASVIARIACEEQKKFAGHEDIPCADLEKLLGAASFSIDPCNGPRVMCPPGGDWAAFANPASEPLDGGGSILFGESG